jgi:hypothetical protein
MSVVAGYFEQAAEAGPQWEPGGISRSDNQGPNTPSMAAVRSGLFAFPTMLNG